MINQTNKYNVKIPLDTSVIYHKKKKVLVIKGPLKQKSLKLKLKIFINKSKKIIHITSATFSQISNNNKKKIEALRNTTIAIIKHVLIETSTLIYKKLKTNGVGYRIFFTETLNKKLITLKLGYSHLMYLKVPDSIAIDFSKKTKFCIFGDSYTNVSQTAALIRSNKFPEPYKGKGVLYEDEIVVLKEGKKT